MREAILFLVFASFAGPQEPTGAIEGVVTDPTGGVVQGAAVEAENKATQQHWHNVSSEEGRYRISSLPPGEYELRAIAEGFKATRQSVVVEAGLTSASHPVLAVGEVGESITVSVVALPLLRTDSFTVGGTITQDFIERVPVNGRYVLEFGKTEPGVLPVLRSAGRTFLSVLQAPQGTNGRGTRLVADGGSVMTVGNGGSPMGFSQEAVREFRLSSVNFDLSTGPTLSGVGNIVTRSGGKDFHGSAVYFFRDHTLAAYPALKRDEANPDPFFQRRQFGLTGSGPIVRDRFFVFGNWERNEQRAVNTTTLAAEGFAHLSGITSSPFFEDLAGVRVDGLLSEKHWMFIRYAHDGNHSFEPGLPQPNAYPSRWFHTSAEADQAVLGLNSALRRSLLNSLYVSLFSHDSNRTGAQEDDCPGCLGVGSPAINVPEVGLFLGVSDINRTKGLRFQVNDSVKWETANHNAVFGVDWEHNRGGPLNWAHEPATIVLFSPSRAQAAGLPVPGAFHTLEDVLALPLSSVTVSVGDARVPQANGRRVRTWDTLRFHFQDKWRVHPGLVVNYGLAWNIDRNLNYDLVAPPLLAPVLGGESARPRRKQWTNFSPLLGLTWAPRQGGTVLRAGAANYYDFFFPPNLDGERAALGPPGVGRQIFEGNSISNLLPGIPPLDYPSPTLFTGADFMTILPSIREGLVQNLENSDHSVQQIQKTKTGTLVAWNFPSASALHVNAGISRRFAENFVVNADFVYKRFSHVGIGAVDVNHFNSVRGSVIPTCSDIQQLNDPWALCSNGAINAIQPVGRASYKGLLVRAENRFSRKLRILGSWAYSRNTGTSDSGANGFNLENWHESRGPLATDLTHIVNVAGIVQMPRRLELGFNFTYSSAPPFSAYVAGNDFNGDGLRGDLLPGSTVNAFNRTMNREDLARLVSQFNQAFAGNTDPKGLSIPTLVLPKTYGFGDNFQALDLRLSRSFRIQTRWELTMIGEVFNVYNAANLSGYTGNLTTTATFGQPTARSGQVFGSGGPRTFQLAMKVKY